MKRKIASDRGEPRKWTVEDIPERAISLISTSAGCVFKKHLMGTRNPDPIYSNLNTNQYAAAQLVGLVQSGRLSSYTERAFKKFIESALISGNPGQPARKIKKWLKEELKTC